MKKISTKINEYKKHLKRLPEYEEVEDYKIIRWFNDTWEGMSTVTYVESIAINNMINREMLKRRLEFKKDEEIP